MTDYYSPSHFETFFGYIETIEDALCVIEACRQKKMRFLRSRPSVDQFSMVRSGSVFVWNETESGINRWVDGRSWTASRIDGAFLTYREKRKPTSKSVGFPNILIKKGFSVLTSDQKRIRLISYYTLMDKNSEKLPRPSEVMAMAIPFEHYPEFAPEGTLSATMSGGATASAAAANPAHIPNAGTSGSAVAAETSGNDKKERHYAPAFRRRLRIPSPQQSLTNIKVIGNYDDSSAAAQQQDDNARQRQTSQSLQMQMQQPQPHRRSTSSKARKVRYSFGDEDEDDEDAWTGSESDSDFEDARVGKKKSVRGRNNDASTERKSAFAIPPMYSSATLDEHHRSRSARTSFDYYESSSSSRGIKRQPSSSDVRQHSSAEHKKQCSYGELMQPPTPISMYPSSANLQSLPGVRYLLTPVSPVQDLSAVTRRLAAAAAAAASDDQNSSESYQLPSLQEFISSDRSVSGQRNRKNSVNLTKTWDPRALSKNELIACEALIACSMGAAGRGYSLAKDTAALRVLRHNALLDF